MVADRQHPHWATPMMGRLNDSAKRDDGSTARSTGPRLVSGGAGAGQGERRGARGVEASGVKQRGASRLSPLPAPLLAIYAIFADGAAAPAGGRLWSLNYKQPLRLLR